MKKINLGCGKDTMEGYINLDIAKLPGVDIVHNLNLYPYPFKDNEFEYVYCDNILEHLNDIIKPLEEIHRISKKGAIVKIIVPVFPSVWTFCDPTHKSVYTYFTLNYFRPEDNLDYYSKAKFNIKKRKIIFQKILKPIEIIINSCEITKKIWAVYLSHLIHAMFLDIELEVIKDDELISGSKAE